MDVYRIFDYTVLDQLIGRYVIYAHLTESISKHTLHRAESSG